MTSEYYKSLISDEEVIKELIKESKRREGKLTTETLRLKPNLNFFQRTVVNLVSNNRRIDKCSTTSQKAANINQTPKYKYSSIKKPLVNHAFERQLVLQTKLKFVRSQQQKSKQVDAKTPSLKHIIDSEESDGSVNILDDIQDETRNLTKISRNYRSNKNSNCNVILISSDDSSAEIVTSECSKVKKKKRRHKKSKGDDSTIERI